MYYYFMSWDLVLQLHGIRNVRVFYFKGCTNVRPRGGARPNIIRKVTADFNATHRKNEW